METSKNNKSYLFGVLVVSDTVSCGEKEDSSGASLVNFLRSSNHFTFSSISSVADSMPDIEKKLKLLVDEFNLDLILTVGGTGFTPRDVTPEATRNVIDKEAPHLASYMVMECCKKTKFAALSRGVCGMRKNSLILNLPGSVKGATECFEAVAPLLPHVLDQLKGHTENVDADHSQIQQYGYIPGMAYSINSWNSYDIIAGLCMVVGFLFLVGGERK